MNYYVTCIEDINILTYKHLFAFSSFLNHSVLTIYYHPKKTQLNEGYKAIRTIQQKITVNNPSTFVLIYSYS